MYNTYWMGKRVVKSPLDLWIYQEIFFKIKPDLIIETGTRHGGSALFFANMCDLLDKGKIISVDIHSDDEIPEHDRITYMTGSSVDPKIIENARFLPVFATDVATFAEVTAFACIAFVSTALSASSDAATASAAMSAAVIVSVAIDDALICDIAICYLVLLIIQALVVYIQPKLLCHHSKDNLFHQMDMV